MKNFNHVAYVPGKTNIIDEMYTDDAGKQRGVFSHETIEEIGQRYPGAVIMTWPEALQAIDASMAAAYVRPPQIITAERFDEMLRVLPPAGWIRQGNNESFKMSEHMDGPYTAIFARIEKTYFELMDKCTTPHAEIIAACSLVMSMRAARS